jgi:glutamate-5-semialdehyde dehydrogenase
VAATVSPVDLEGYCRSVAEQARAASRRLVDVHGTVKNEWLIQGAALLRERGDQISAANDLDVAAAQDSGLTAAQIDRLRLSRQGINGIAKALEEIALLPDPIGEVIESTVRPNGLEVMKQRVPLGVVFFIYESRPNVTADAAALCVKSGNAVILRGGKEALNSNRAIAEILFEAAESVGLPDHCAQLVETTDRDAVGHFLKMRGLIDLAIPRGGEGLIRRVAREATMPVLKHFAGNCHVYIDRDADFDVAERLTVNSKCQRYGVCNAAESLLIHAEVATTMIPRLCRALTDQGVEIRGDDAVRAHFSDALPATDEDYAAEYLGPVISVKIVGSLEQAVDHIHRYGSGHTEAIVTRSLAAAREFTRRVDSSAVMVNTSTRFNDGGELGLGAEIGISTDKFHARGPCGLKELTSYKYVVYGDGQIRG